MEASEVAEKLRACAAEMKLASVTLRANADQLKETARIIGNDAAKILHPILSAMKAGPSAPLWEFMLPTLRKVLKRQVDLDKDRDAFKTVWVLSDGTVTHDHYLECDLTELERERFYQKQARDWAELIKSAADHVREVPIDEPLAQPTDEELAFKLFVKFGGTYAHKQWKASGKNGSYRKLMRKAEEYARENGLSKEWQDAKEKHGKRGPKGNHNSA